jgi:hypothetical protein
MLGGKKLGEKIASSLEAKSDDWGKDAKTLTNPANQLLTETVAITLRILAGVIREETSK